MTIREMREHYATHDMNYDGVAAYGWMDDYLRSHDLVGEAVNLCRVCNQNIITIVSVGAICQDCRLSGGYNSGRFVG